MAYNPKSKQNLLTPQIIREKYTPEQWSALMKRAHAASLEKRRANKEAREALRLYIGSSAVPLQFEAAAAAWLKHRGYIVRKHRGDGNTPQPAKKVLKRINENE